MRRKLTEIYERNTLKKWQEMVAENLKLPNCVCVLIGGIAIDVISPGLFRTHLKRIKSFHIDPNIFPFKFI